jgi:hypothetical protein
MDHKRYSTLWDRVFSCPDRTSRAVAFVALSLAARKRIRTVRARKDAGAFERSDYSILRHDLRNRVRLILSRAAECSRLHGTAAREYEAIYGDHGPLVSGVVREHFPEEVKDRLRRLARAASGSSFAYSLWRATGATATTYHRERSRLSFGFYG